MPSWTAMGFSADLEDVPNAHHEVRAGAAPARAARPPRVRRGIRER
ncbi:hypothetical protein [Streptomyces vinaceus]